MAIDVRRVALAAADAALQSALEDSRQAKRAKANHGGGKSKHLSPMRAVLIGAGVMTAARLALGSRGRTMLENLEQRLAEAEDGED
jgi:hypothetical protein